MRFGRMGRMALLCAVCLLLGGCSALSFDVRSQLVPPTATGDEKDIQTALETYLTEEYGAATAGQYKLKYPLEGAFRTAFIVRDLDEDGADEAVAFYTIDNDTEYVHLNYLRKVGEEWQSLSDWESESTTTREVRFGDMNGDGRQEMLVGLELSSLQDSRLSLFQMSKKAMTPLASYLYTDFYLGNVSSDDWQDLLLLRSNRNDLSATAGLISLRDGQAVELGSVAIDGHIRSFDKVVFGAVSDTVAGVYIDGVKDEGELVTELVCWDGDRLSAPFYDAESNLTQLTARTSGIAMADVDADGVTEWPQSTEISRVSEKDGAEQSRWLTRWCAWDFDKQKVQTKLYSVVVPEDGYLFVLDEAWSRSAAASYDAETQKLTIGRAGADGKVKPAVIIRARYEDGNPDAGECTYETVQLQSGRTFYIWFDPQAGLGTELSEILYRITVMP